VALVAHILFFRRDNTLLAPAVGAYFDSKVVVEILRVNAFCFLFMAFEVVPSALLMRDMKFKQLSIFSAIANSVAAVVTLGMAYLGYGFWSLVFGEISFLAVKTALLLIVNPIRFWPLFHGPDVATAMRFGGHLSVHGMIVYVFLHMDIAIAGRVLPPEEVGLYSVALQLALMPLKKLMPMLKAVAFPAFSRIQDSAEDISRYVLKAQKLSLLLTIPVFWGLSSVIPSIIPLVLGDKWLGAVPPSQLVLLVMPLRFCAELFNPALKSQRRVAEMIGNSLIATGVMLFAIAVGVRFGATGMALSWLLGYPIAFALIIRRNSRFLQFPALQLTGMAVPPVTCGFLMLLFVYGIAQLSFLSNPLLLGLQLVGGASTYCASLYLIDKNSILELQALFWPRKRTASH
jgi:O-antigen/teichoic acid export membrane protein